MYMHRGMLVPHLWMAVTESKDSPCAASILLGHVEGLGGLVIPDAAGFMRGCAAGQPLGQTVSSLRGSGSLRTTCCGHIRR